jgi:hypothetical protein
MRVQMKYNAIPTSCETFSLGQVEDYTINISLTAAGLVTDPNSEISNENFDFTISPNPTESRLNVSFSSENATYEIMNYLGQEVKKGKLNQDGIDVNDLNSGIYFLKVNSNQKSVSKKFIKR